jgi:capsular exopolysaccharide synthesis family protein
MSATDEPDIDDLDGGEPRPATASRNLLQVLWQHRSLILLAGAAGLVVGLLYYSQKPPVFQSRAQVLVVKKRSDALPVAGGDPRLSFYEDYVSTHLVLIRSPLVVERAVRKKDLGALPSLAAGGDPTGAILAGLSAGRNTAKDGSTAPDNIINLSYRGGDANDTGVILTAVIDSYRDFLDETYRNVSDNTLDLITRARDLLKKDIAEKEKKYRDFRSNSPLLWKGVDGANIHVGRIREFQGKQTALLARGGEIRERLLAIDKAKKAGSSPSVLLALATRPLDKAGKETNLQRAMEEQLFPLLLKEKALLQDYGKDHPEVIRVREQIAMTKQLYQRLDAVNKKASVGQEMRAQRLQTHVDALRQELALVETAHAALARLLQDEESKARALERYEIDDAAFRSDIARTTKVLDETLKRLEQINLVRDFGGYEARAISVPGAGAKVSPIAWQLLAGGAMLGLLLGVGLAYLLDVADKSFRTPEEIRRRLRLPIVGHIPYLSHTGELVTVSTGGQTVELDAALCTVHRPTSTDAEAYRSVRTALYFNTHGERHKVVQVTSPSMGDGKSTLITNLAVAIAQSGRKVVLVDADLRRPRVHRVFGLTARVGLAQVIAGSAELADTLRPTTVPGLSVVPCGARPTQPAELLTLPRFADVLEELRESYDYVLVDTPPLLAVSDPCAVAPRVDGVLLTIRVAKNGRPAAERARDLLAALRVHVFGVVVNGVGKQGAMSGYGYEHYKYADDYAAEYTSTGGEAEAGAAGDEAPADPGASKPPPALVTVNGAAG